MPGVSTEDELRMLYNIIDLSGARPRMDDLAVRMGLKKDATAWRYGKLMKRLKAEFCSPPAAQASGPATGTANPSVAGRKKATGSNKRQMNSSDGDDSDHDKRRNKAKKPLVETEINAAVDGETTGHEATDGIEDVAEEA